MAAGGSFYCFGEPSPGLYFWVSFYPRLGIVLWLGPFLRGLKYGDFQLVDCISIRSYLSLPIYMHSRSCLTCSRVRSGRRVVDTYPAVL